MNQPEQAVDAFISHSSRDKHTFVRPLVECLVENGARVWYDEYSMAVGDSLSVSIDHGLRSARFGVVVISPAFIQTAEASGWTHYEMRGIVANSIGFKHRRILPIWLDVDWQEVRSWSPPLADILAVDASRRDVEEVALNLMRVLAPDRAGGLMRYRALQDAQRGGHAETVNAKSFVPSPPRERRVPGHVALRAALVTRILAGTGLASAADFDAFLENLSRDVHHEEELRTWEAIASSFVATRQAHALNDSKLRNLYSFLLMATMGKADEAAVEALGPEIAAYAWQELQALMPFVRHQVVIGEGGLRGILAPATHPEVGDGDPELGGR